MDNRKNRRDFLIFKSLLIWFILILLPFNLAAIPSKSSFLPLDSPFYEEFDTLLSTIGIQSNKTRPYTYAEAEMYLNRIDTSDFTEIEMSLYEDLRNMVKTEEGKKTVSFDKELSLQPELYIHTNLDFKDRVDFLNGDFANAEYKYDNTDKFLTWDRDKPHFLDLDLSLTFADRVSLLFRFPITNTVHTGIPSGSRYVMSNIPFLASFSDFSNHSFQDFSMNFPYRAHMSIADSWYSILIGRERFEYGAGKTGNFIIDESLPYHNALSISFFSETFKYNFLLSFFPHPSQYITSDNSGKINTSEDGTEYDTDLIFNQNENAFTGIKMFMAHRFDWTIREGKSRLAITEGIMYQNDEGFLDLQVLNPMMFFHNMYIAGNSNSILQVEFDTTLVKGVNQHLAIAVDDYNIPFEDTDGSEQRPNAIGLQLGINTSHGIGNGFLSSNVELTYMSPYFYLRDGKDESSYPLDFVIAIRNQRSAAGVYDLYSIGYPNGGDQTIIYTDISYWVPNIYKVQLSAEYRLFGRNNVMTVYMHGDSSSPLTHMLKLSLCGEYKITKNMKIKTTIQDAMYFNYGNEKGRNENDLSFTVSYSYRI